VLPAEPVRWMHANFERAADDWEAWARELQELFSGSQ
jgi:iron(III) transport system substrate-binding protein